MATTYYHWDVVNDCVMHETNEVGDTLVTYTREPRQSGPLISETRDGTTFTHHYDALGSTTMLTDDTGAVTDTFQSDADGNSIARTGTTPTPYQWMGRLGYQSDTPTGGYYVRANSYLPEIARWITMDLAAFSGLMNRYSFLANSPINAPADGPADATSIFVNPVAQKLKTADCGTDAFLSWNFILTPKNPCKFEGYFVQKVSVNCFRSDCKFDGDQTTYTYFEAWPVAKGTTTSAERLRGKAAVDTAIVSPIPDNTIGIVRQDGEIKFFCDPDGNLLTGANNKFVKSNQWHGPVDIPQCRTSSGGLLSWDPSSGKSEPTFWNSNVLAEGSRSFRVDWNCCVDCRHKKFVKATGEPKMNTNQ